MNVLAERLGKALEALGTTPHKFAAKHGSEQINRKTVFNVLEPTSKPGFGIIARICELEPAISAEYLLRGIGEPLKPDYAVGDTDPCAKYKAHIIKQSQQNDDILSD